MQHYCICKYTVYLIKCNKVAFKYACFLKILFYSIKKSLFYLSLIRKLEIENHTSIFFFH